MLPAEVPLEASHFLRPDWPAPHHVQALCSTRLGGVSAPPFDSLNLGLHVQDDAALVMQNRARLQQACGARPVFLHQVHGIDVQRIDANTVDGVTADACWSDQTQVACTIMVADCLPVLFTDTQGQVVAAAHAGWRGLAAGVIEASLSALCQAASVQTSHVLVWLGPCIGPHAFEVGDEVRAAFETEAAVYANAHSNAHTFQREHAWPLPQQAFRPTGQTGKWWADLAGLARWRLMRAGVTHIYGNDSNDAWCTVTQSQRFFSYRRDGRSGRFAACVWRTA